MGFSISGPSGTLRIVLFVLLGIGVTGYGAYSYTSQASALNSAVEVDATVTSTSVEEDSRRRGVDYIPQATFTYTYNGEEYTSSNVYPGPLSKKLKTEDAAESALEGYQEEETVTAYVPQGEPENAYLKHERSAEPLVLTGFGVLFLVASIYAAVKN
ncbi:DUF3592 domain-containing protein [Haladaptatus sp. F3-133]|uniref:DUF3592 domain-containing protein n=1 Tax=Halorutilus salinus TaxID=2487751 RepID=A0A9Q4C7G8_9EURY|nr:DUF3592 domain-containing protein [Halorutilus salinus]MCX2819676.1 DUF3592 domain-containing protein [Halorutilus salinus]